MKSTLLAQQTIPLTRANNLRVAQTHYSTYVQNEEPIVDCPDCFDTMVKIYEIDKIRYHCENCDLVIGDLGAQVFDE